MLLFTKVLCYFVLMKGMVTKHCEFLFYLFNSAVKPIITQRPRWIGTMGALCSWNTGTSVVRVKMCGIKRDIKDWELLCTKYKHYLLYNIFFCIMIYRIIVDYENRDNYWCCIYNIFGLLCNRTHRLSIFNMSVGLHCYGTDFTYIGVQEL